MSVETLPELHGRGHGRRFIDDAVCRAPADRWLFAAVSPGNARSLRAFLAAGFRPLASEVIITPA
jgi:L-amino acid N-acyltransferase YncA